MVLLTSPPTMKFLFVDKDPKNAQMATLGVRIVVHSDEAQPTSRPPFQNNIDPLYSRAFLDQRPQNKSTHPSLQQHLYGAAQLSNHLDRGPEFAPGRQLQQPIQAPVGYRTLPPAYLPFQHTQSFQGRNVAVAQHGPLPSSSEPMHAAAQGSAGQGPQQALQTFGHAAQPQMLSRLPQALPSATHCPQQQSFGQHLAYQSLTKTALSASVPVAASSFPSALSTNTADDTSLAQSQMGSTQRPTYSL